MKKTLLPLLLIVGVCFVFCDVNAQNADNTRHIKVEKNKVNQKQDSEAELEKIRIEKEKSYQEYSAKMKKNETEKFPDDRYIKSENKLDKIDDGIGIGINKNALNTHNNSVRGIINSLSQYSIQNMNLDELKNFIEENKNTLTIKELAYLNDVLKKNEPKTNVNNK